MKFNVKSSSFMVFLGLLGVYRLRGRVSDHFRAECNGSMVDAVREGCQRRVNGWE